jgi:predicted site-specific integrase-resolvase
MLKLDEYVRIAEAAEYLGVHHNTLRNWGRTGRIPDNQHSLAFQG